jgi:glucose-1-phosphate thymidylyltransferase
MAVVGVYYFSETRELKNQLHTLIQKDITTRGEYQFTDALEAMIDAGHTLVPYEIDGWYDCGQKETLLATNRALLSRAPSALGIAGSVLIPPVYVAPDATVEQAIVGPYVSIGAGAVVRDCIVRNSIISAGAHVSDIVLEGSLIGTATEIRGHFKKFNVGDNSEVADL